MRKRKVVEETQPVVQKPQVVGYADMTPHQKLIVKGSQTIAGSVPNDLSGDDLVQWLNDNLLSK